MIREHNTSLLKKRLPRLGKYVIDSAETARNLLKYDIPNNPDIPEKVKRAMTIAFKEMLNPKKRQQNLADMSPVEMMKTVILADSDAPPMVLKMQEKLKAELGEKKFEELKTKYK